MFNNHLAQYQKSYHEKGEEFVDGKIVNENGEELFPYYGEYYTKEERAKEVQRVHEYLEANRAERQAIYDNSVREYEAEDARYRDLQSRRDGNGVSGESSTYNWGTVKDEGMPGSSVMAVLLLVLVGGGAIIAALASVIR